jgi:outer membrane receptor protein involved in Fe transport
MRRSFLDLFTDDLGFGGVPVLYSFNGKAVYDLSPRDRVWAVNVSGVDRIRLGLTEGADLTEEISNFDIRYRGNRTATGVNWQRLFGTRGVGLFGVTFSRASVNQQAKDLIRGGVPPDSLPVDEQIANGDIVFREASVERELDVKYDLTLELPAATTLQVGTAVKVFNADYDAASPFGTDSPYFPLDVNPFAIRSALRTTQPGVYVQGTRTILPRLDATVGVRWDRYNYLSASRTSPRVGLRYQLTPAVSLTGAVGRYYQQPFFLFVAAFPQNRDLKPFRADHLVGGIVLGDGSGDKMSLEVYRKTYHDYPVSADIGPLSLANIGDTFALRDILFPMTSDGRGTVRGIEALASRRRLPGRRWSGQANVAWSQARHAGIDGVLHPGSFDSPVVANAIGTYTLSPKWDASFKWTFLKGRPHTPVDVERATAERRAVYDLAQMNALRQPDYQRLDLRVDRRFIVRGQPVTFFAGAQNITNRKNVASIGWDRRANTLRTSYQQGIFPILGLDWSF